jgi:hypothetical protein
VREGANADSSRPAAKLQLVERGKDYAIATVGSLYVQVCQRTTRLDLLEAIDRTEGAFLAKVGAPIRSLFVIRNIALTGPPDAAFRTKAAYLMEKYSPSLVGTAQVIEGSGFGTSIMRAFVTGITIVSRQKVPTRAFAALEPSLAWLAGLGTADPSLADRDALCDQIRALEPG